MDCESKSEVRNMSDNRVDIFVNGLTDLIDQHRKENSLTFAEVIGVLDIAKHELYTEMALVALRKEQYHEIAPRRKEEIQQLIAENNGTCTSCFGACKDFFTGWADGAGNVVIGPDELLCAECARLRGVEG